MSEVKIDLYEINFDSIAQCLNMLRNVRVYYAMSEVKVDTHTKFVGPTTIGFAFTALKV